MEPVPHGHVAALRDIETIIRRLRALEATLAPFANYARSVLACTSRGQPGTQKYIQHDHAVLTIGDLRRVRDTCSEGGPHDLAKDHGKDADGAGEIPTGNHAKSPASSRAASRAYAGLADHQRARAIVESPSVLATYAAPEWDELTEDGRQWIIAIVREATHGLR